jgi:CubicO group peptidase (beta-lactamase class C family)
MRYQSNLPKNPASLIQVENYIRNLIERGQPPGLSAVVVKDGKIIYCKAFGWADSPKKLPASPNTRYHWWSMTKVATAVAILQLQDAGLLNIDDPIREHLSFFHVYLDDKPAPAITIRQVLRHTSGLPDTIPAMLGWVHYEDDIYPQTDLLRKHLPSFNQLKFHPDSKSAYSNLGYAVLGAIIEKVRGIPYEKYIQDHILTPLGMTQTGFLYSPEMVDQIAAGSHPIFNIYTPMLPLLLNMRSLVRQRDGLQLWFNNLYLDMTPPSGLIGPVKDAAKLVNALLMESDILSYESHTMLKPQGIKPIERPLGWAEFNEENRLWLQHSGGGPGFATVMRIYPEENLGIVIMANNTNLPRERLVEAFAHLDWTYSKELS